MAVEIHNAPVDIAHDLIRNPRSVSYIIQEVSEPEDVVHGESEQEEEGKKQQGQGFGTDQQLVNIDTSMDSLEMGAAGGESEDGAQLHPGHFQGGIINIDELTHDELSDSVPGEEDLTVDHDPFKDEAFMASIKTVQDHPEHNIEQATENDTDHLTLMGRFKTLRRKSRGQKQVM